MISDLQKYAIDLQYQLDDFTDHFARHSINIIEGSDIVEFQIVQRPYQDKLFPIHHMFDKNFNLDEFRKNLIESFNEDVLKQNLTLYEGNTIYFYKIKQDMLLNATLDVADIVGSVLESRKCSEER